MAKHWKKHTPGLSVVGNGVLVGFCGKGEARHELFDGGGRFSRGPAVSRCVAVVRGRVVPLVAPDGGLLKRHD
jgi:hypothetical protein